MSQLSLEAPSRWASAVFPLEIIQRITEHVGQPLVPVPHQKLDPKSPKVRAATLTLLAISRCNRALRALAMPILVRNQLRFNISATRRNPAFAAYTAPRWGRYVGKDHYTLDCSLSQGSFLKLNENLPPPKSIRLQLSNALITSPGSIGRLKLWLDKFYSFERATTTLSVFLPWQFEESDVGSEGGVSHLSWPLITHLAPTLVNLSLCGVFLAGAACKAILASPNLRYLTLLDCKLQLECNFDFGSLPKNPSIKLASLVVDDTDETIEFVEYLFIHAETEHLGLQSLGDASSDLLDSDYYFFSRKKPACVSIAGRDSLLTAEEFFGKSVDVLRLEEDGIRVQTLRWCLTSDRFPRLKHLCAWRHPRGGWKDQEREEVRDVCKEKGIMMSSYEGVFHLTG